VLSDLQIALGATAVLAGVTGAWSPCGFSMVDTLAGPARERGRRLLLPACAAFTLGALAGGTALFVGLAVLGAGLGLGGETSTEAAALVAAAGALAELAGARIRPQIRRQVPEPWRRRLPLPLASALYGILLGLGFTTFVLTLAVVALAVACVASGQPALGAIVGLGFGLGRALPVVALAPITDRPLGLFMLRLMAERPASLRLLRALDGVALIACALLLAPGVAGAATRLTAGADPTAAAGALAWQPPSGPGVLRRANGLSVALPGNDPALGAGYVAWHVGDEVTVAKRTTLAPVLSRKVARVSELAVSSHWLVWRARRPSGDAIGAVKLADPRSVRRVAAARAPGQLGRPDLDGDRLVFHVAGPGGSAIREVNLRTGRRRTRARARRAQLLGPSLLGRALLFVRLDRCRQRLILRRRGRTRVLLRRGPLAGSDVGFDPGHTSQGGMHPCPLLRGSRLMLWSTALSSRFAYVTALAPRAAGARAAILRTRRRAPRR